MIQELSPRLQCPMASPMASRLVLLRLLHQLYLPHQLCRHLCTSKEQLPASHLHVLPELLKPRQRLHPRPTDLNPVSKSSPLLRQTATPGRLQASVDVIQLSWQLSPLQARQLRTHPLHHPLLRTRKQSLCLHIPSSPPRPRFQTSRNHIHQRHIRKVWLLLFEWLGCRQRATQALRPQQ